MNNPNSTHNGNPQNQANPIVPRNRSHFSIMPDLATTQRFGEISPHFLAWNIPSDGLKFLNKHNLRTYSLKAPLMQDLLMHKHYFKIPYQAILPFHFDKFYTNPTIGDDVPYDVFTSVENFRSRIATWCTNHLVFTWSTYSVSAFYDLLYSFILGELFYSRGSLLNTLGYSMDCKVLYNSTNYVSFDAYFDAFFSEFSSYLDQTNYLTFRCPDGSYFNVANNFDIISNDYESIDVRTFIERLRDGITWTTVSITCTQSQFEDMDEFVSSIFDELSSYDTPIFTSTETACDLAPLFAYQMVCAHFFTNDHVDYVYSSTLFRQLIRHYLDDLTLPHDTFTLNGMDYEYDYLSSHYFISVLNTPIASLSEVVPYFTTLFSFRHSLRYMDYFIGSKTQPLAVGNVNAPVSGGNVSIIDVTQKIQVQRFLNAVNRTGRKLSNYIRGLFGVDVKPDMHDPLFLGDDVANVLSNNVQNTGVSQTQDPNSITANLYSNGTDFAFEIDGDDRPCLVLGVTWYDIKRFYTKSTYRNYYHRNRFDMFNPFLQYIGDQKVYQEELDSRCVGTFGYQTRYMEYMQSHPRAVAGFTGSLPGYLFLDSNNKISSKSPVLSPSVIRSNNVEFDNFYVSLTGYSLGTYFHFIVLYSNDSEYDRNMSASPQIL